MASFFVEYFRRGKESQYRKVLFLSRQHLFYSIFWGPVLNLDLLPIKNLKQKKKESKAEVLHSYFQQN